MPLERSRISSYEVFSKEMEELDTIGIKAYIDIPSERSIRYMLNKYN